MAPRSLIAAVSLIALSTAPAIADVTPAEVWADWQDMAERYGMTTETAGVDETSSAVTVRGLVLRVDGEGGTGSVDAGDVTFRDLGDGRVAVDLPATMPMQMTFPDGEGSEGEISMSINHTGLEMIVSGNAVDRVYDYSADSYGVSDIEIMDPSSSEDEVELSLELVLNVLAGRATILGQDTLEYTSEVDAESLILSGSGSGTDEMGQPASFEFSAEALGVFERSSGTLTSMSPDDSPAQAIAKGFAAEGRVGYEAMAYSTSGEGMDGPFQISGTTERGEGSVTIGEDGISYATDAGPQTVSIMGSMPFPVSFGIESSGASISFPVVPREEPQAFGLSFNLTGLELDEMIWNMFDPGAQVPRDPANLALDLTGEVIVTDDFLSNNYAETAEAAPGTIEGVTLNELRLEIAGAALTGTGDFDFIQTEMMPQPVGQIDLLLKGGNALIDTLVSMGMLPAEQAMGARMMMGLFAVPGEGEDELTTTIEMREDGGIYANGQRVQ